MTEQLAPDQRTQMLGEALPCPKCGGTAMEARAIKAVGKQSMLTGYYWYCSNDVVDADQADCEFDGPERPTSHEALEAWNALPREPK